MAESPSPSAQAARERLAAQLRDLRLDAGISAHELSARCGWSPAKTSRLEHAKAAPSDADVRTWCEACGFPEQAPDMVAANRQADRLYAEWRRLNRSGLLRHQEDVLLMIEHTRVQRVYVSNVVPGFLQTMEYARALLRAITQFQGTPDDVEAAARSRTQRERALRGGERRFVVLMEESVLRYRIGGRDVMAGQLAHLLEVIGLPSVALGVIPFTADRVTMWPLEAMYIFDDERVVVESLTAEVNVTAPSQVRVYQRAFRELGSMAVYGPTAKALIERALDALA
ncbi:helix-turn-helix domain-containing protein [Streptacidiphilus sp. PB12-B1b]|uniref:helix-turn-helix domain-containing protein n=1 Tax=Streptacidiphilus sp. PB12-B1b TaxID=2705012 RepID=UPI0015F9687D|nr:helix-turn-helix transcriptional regulator [Streptacidiphilus sp. PB12-B1b]QMU78878.1 helix-turn-helix domain-containing protein [Streptacidiphilus sp. PB12-B1b]